MDIQRAYTDALERALGVIVGDARRQVETYRLQADAVIAALSARVAETETRLAAMEADAEKRIAERLAEVRDGADVDMDDVARRIEAAVAALPPPRDGRDADPEVIRAMVSEAVAAIPPAKDGADADPEMIRAMVAEAVAALPLPKDGADADPEVIRAMVAEAVAAIPPAKDGADADPEMIRAMVAEAVAAIPRPKDGADADPAVIEAMVAEAMAAIPRPKDGVDADPDDIAERVLARLPTRDELRGAPGRLPVARAWTDGVHYESDVVVFDGGTYQAIRDTGRDPTHDDWVCLAAPGAKGAGYSWRGTFAPTGEYRARDIVMCDGAAWCAKQDDPGACPGDGWHLWASRGSRGGQGPRGERGEPGATIAGVEADDQGMVTFKMSDGRKLQVDMYPLFSKFDR